MNYFLSCLGANAVSIACVICAGVMAVKGIPHWGYFLFIALFCSETVHTRSSSHRESAKNDDKPTAN